MEKMNLKEKIYTIMYCLGIVTFILIEWYLIMFYPLVLLIITIILGILVVFSMWDHSINNLDKRESKEMNKLKKYKNVFYYIFYHSLDISLILAIFGLLSFFIFSMIIGFILFIIVYVYNLIIFELIENYLWKNAKEGMLELYKNRYK